jgi:hypothetical protein
VEHITNGFQDQHNSHDGERNVHAFDPPLRCNLSSPGTLHDT